MESVAGRASSALLLVVSLALVALVAVVGGAASARGASSWYETLDRAPWSPPGWVFGPAWTVLYVLMAVAAWLVAGEGLSDGAVRAAIGLYVAQLALNLAWPILFFGLRLPGWALVDILALLALVTATTVAFHRVAPAAAWLLVPYLAWLAYATTLNAWVALR